MAEAILNQPQFQEVDKAREYMEALRWPNGPVCPHCGSAGQHYKLEGKAHRPGLWKCKDCREQFTVTVGTLFADSKVPLNKWLQACYLMSVSKNGVSAKQLERMLGVTYKTAWFMGHCIREAMTGSHDALVGGDGGSVEVDETYRRNTGKQAKGARGYAHKMKVVSVVERNGHKRSFHVANVAAATVRPILKAQISEKARLMTDATAVYKKIGRKCSEYSVVTLVPASAPTGT